MKVAFHTLGCKVNQYESEAMWEQFKKAGFERVGEDEAAQVYVINSCSVTNMADRKTRQYIRKMKRQNPDAIVALTGCYAQLEPKALAQMAELDIICGINRKDQILPKVMEKLAGNLVDEIDVLSYDELDQYMDNEPITSMESRTRAYIKIQEGCNRFCSYCIIPFARGKVRSRSVESIVNEAKGLIEKGFKELILTGINTALYGMEEGFCWEGEEKGVEIIIAQLNALEGDFRIRLSSLEPTVVDSDYVKRLFKYDKLCHHLHLSCQSGSDKILKAMNRRYTRDEYIEIANRLRDFDPYYGITTDLIVGFPGEDEKDFADSLDLVEKVNFLKVHAFPYSVRPNTKAAGMDNQIEAPVKKERNAKLIKAGEESCQRFLTENLGRVERVIFEEYEGAYATGYSDNYIKVYVKELPESSLNKIISVKLLSLFKDGILAEVGEE
ncbi:MAG: tRNA (N(6)-L-threonylcarbamoyladenosine(37)-C(2))-methylthiotransferase MtaB [Clostridia bacterium]|nr:tRNA (N(6)-L-threonylcarbamoyladenosine(37)-C(2))-methylthiotransferase MtaB [Clostridia bacterium]